MLKRSYYLMMTAFLGLSLMMPVSVAQASQTDALIEKLVSKGVLTRLEAEEVRVEVETATEQVVEDIVYGNNGWLEGLESKGDIRVRWEGFDRDQTDGSDRQRARVRARWGLEKEFNDEWKAGFRISTGPNDEAVSTNQSLDDQFTFKNLWLNRAYGIYTPTKHVQEILPANTHTEIGAGKVANPYKKWGTSLVWDGDVEPEGIYQKMDFNLSKWGKKGTWDLHTLTGQWSLEEESSRKDVTMNSYGIGSSLKNADGDVKLVGKYVFYDWQNYDSVLRSGTTSETDTHSASGLGTSPAGNDLQVDAFKIHSVYGELGFKDVPLGLFGNHPMKLFGQWVHNSEEGDAVANPGNDNAWTLGVTLGKAKKQGSGQFTYQYYEVEENSTVGDFSESDLGDGGTNKEGHKLQYKYQLTDAIQFAWTNWLVDDIINSSPLVDQEVYRTQIDVVFKF